jgi:uncharacterized protein YecT (DUF1311 family)
MTIPLLLFGIQSFGQDTNQIDMNLRACLDSSQNYTTLGMIHCTYCAEQSWDAKMNKYYKLLQGVLTADGKEKLKESQIKWLAYRDAELSTISTIFDLQGTMWSVVREDERMELVKHRALELGDYYATLTQH